MMDLSEGYGGRGGAQSWQARIAQPQPPQVRPFDMGQFQEPSMIPEPMPYDYSNPFQGGEVNMGDMEGAGETEEDYMTFQLPQSMQGGGGGGGNGWKEFTGAVDFSDFDIAAMKGLFPELMLKDINDQAMEQAGLGGTRWSSVLGQKIADANARAEEQWATDMFAKWIASQEAAKQRGLSHKESAAGRGLQRSMFAQRLPMEVAGMMAKLGGQAQEAEMQPWSVAYEDWMRTTPEAAMGTYGQGLLGMLGQEPGGPTQYQPGWASGLMGIGSSLLPFVGGGGGGGSAASGRPASDFSSQFSLSPYD